ncbi:uncharacterized protein LOC127847114 [Dreissena polymorpha]|uniref:C2H2-type domain-containing protein n=1 Tax=Dreissena polymorpha TaxID=45954 RepID=A0A9D4DS65_DREPO|nr:uncharacterized protein LOC127847114 [Dreissena polymorpha]XP_052234707.1 uncharacterized protein LOC127847114 [Dreissena polymorpha]KAH3753660.1 hypothetical protein DPMN_188302 [Dreissena polymorpha]
MRRLDDDPSKNVGVTPEIIKGSGFNVPQSMMGASGQATGPDMESASVSISVSLSCSQENLNVPHDSSPETVIRSREIYGGGNMLNVGPKFIPSARSFESALGDDSGRQSQGQVDARQFFGSAAQSFESTLPRYKSYEHNLDTSGGRLLEPVVPEKSDRSLKKSKLQNYESGSCSNVLEIPINYDTRRRHSFGGNEERLEAAIFTMRHSNSGEEPRRKQVLRKQIAIDVEEPLRSDSPGKVSPFSVTVSSAEEKRVISQYNIDSRVHQLQDQRHITVIRTTPFCFENSSKGDQKTLDQRKESPAAKDNRYQRPSPERAMHFKPIISIISNESGISPQFGSQYLVPIRDFSIGRGFSSGSEDSPGPSSREPSPFRKEALRAVSPYSKERYRLSTPTPVIKKPMKKEAWEMGYEFNKQSSSGSSDAGSSGGVSTYPEYFASIVITNETGETVNCKTEDFHERLEVPEGMHRRHVHPGNFKKHLHARYLDSLRSSWSSSSTDTSQEHLSQEKSDSFNRSSSDVFDSTETDGKEGYLRPILCVRGSSETCASDDNDVQMESVIKTSPRSSHIHEQQALDLSQKLSSDSQGLAHLDKTKHVISGPKISVDSPSKVHSSVRQGLSSHGLVARSHLGHHTHSDPDLLSPSPSVLQASSPSVYQRSTHLLPQLTTNPQSPLCSVPEGDRVFQFSFSSPFEGAHLHVQSDPEFGSPMSPGLLFTFPPRGTISNSTSDLNQMGVSTRAFYQNAAHHMHKSHQNHSMSFDSANILQIDQRRAMSETEAYLCRMCSQVFPSYDNLAKHMAKHLPTETVRTGDNKIHYCKVCNKSFSRSDMLTRHMRLHTGLKPYECSDCGQVFSRSDHLNTHKRTHTGEKPYRCPQCPYAACRRDMITRHLRTHIKRSAKRGKYLSVPEREAHEVRKSSLSSTDTTSSLELSSRTYSSGDSFDLEVGSGSISNIRSKSLVSTDSSEMEFSTSRTKLWSSPSAESGVFEQEFYPKVKSQTITQSRSFESRFDGKKLLASHQFRQIRNVSSTSFESFESPDDVLSHTDSIAEEAGESSLGDDTSNLPIEPESLEKCSLVEKTGDSAC